MRGHVLIYQVYKAPEWAQPPVFTLQLVADKEKWTAMRSFIINEISNKFIDGYIAQDITQGCDGLVSEFYMFGLANERSGENGE